MDVLVRRSGEDRVVRETLGRQLSEVSRARSLVRGALLRWGLEHLVAPIELAVSELVSNALRHGEGLVGLTVALDDDELRVEVSDQGGGQPRMRRTAPSAAEPGGWGLRLVDQLADRWGSHRERGRTLVWFTRRV